MTGSPLVKDTATIPTVNIHKCDGDGQCIKLCPNEVFEMHTLSAAEIEKLPFLPRLKVRIKGAEKSRPVNLVDCDACGLCVENCHERAIELVVRQEQSAADLIAPTFAEPASCASPS